MYNGWKVVACAERAAARRNGGDRMKKIVHKPAAPIYAAAVVWILYALLFPLYRVGHFALCAAASAAVYLLSLIHI